MRIDTLVKPRDSCKQELVYIVVVAASLKTGTGQNIPTVT